MDQTATDFLKYFESPRLVLRRYHPGDGKWFYAMSQRNHDHLQRYEADNAAANIPSEGIAEELIASLAEAWEKGSYFFLGGFEKKSGEFVVQVYVEPVNRTLPEYEIGYFVDVEHEGQGYVTEAVRATLAILFDQVGAHRVSLKCDQTNLRSLRVAERCHMTREGLLRENRRNPDGTYASSLVYGLLKSEYPDFFMAQGMQFSHEIPSEGGAEEIAHFLAERWGSEQVVSRSKITGASRIPRFIARAPDGRLIGLLTYLIDLDSQSCELVSINSESEGRGIATHLLGMLETEAREKGCKRIWLITTNDNPEAAAFYVKRGFRLTAVHLNALERSRELKPQIPLVGKHGIRLKDEWEYEKVIQLDAQLE